MKKKNISNKYLHKNLSNKVFLTTIALMKLKVEDKINAVKRKYQMKTMILITFLII